MWPEWLKSPNRIHSLPITPKSPKHFTCSSFKDVQTILKESLPEPFSPKKPSLFHRVRLSTSFLRSWTHRHATPLSLPSVKIPNADSRSIVLYFTSLRVVRRTFEDCKIVRSMLRGFRVAVDERDLSMDADFLTELQSIIGCSKVTLPVVFIGGRYIGGVEEIKQMHDNGQLKKMVAKLPFIATGVCDMCRGHRFVLCDECDGSHRIYSEKSGFKACSACNLNGLTRCRSCCSSIFWRSG